MTMQDRAEETRLLVETLRGLGIDAMAHPELHCVSLFDDEFHESHDYDVVGPRQRQAVAIAARGLRWKSRGARIFEAPSGAVFALPRPAGVLAASPLDEALRAFEEGADVAILTPTQTLLLMLDRREALGEGRVAERAVALAARHPANLPKIADIASSLGAGALFRRLRPGLDAAQRDFVGRRRAGR